MARTIVPVSINDESIMEHLETKENKSLYIRDLIKKDMQQGSHKINQEIKKYIEDYIRSNFSTLQPKEEDANIGQFKDCIEDIFNMQMG